MATLEWRGPEPRDGQEGGAARRRWEDRIRRSIASGAPSVVAEVLSDGTVRPLADLGLPDERALPGWATGKVMGDGWILWWERRSFRRD